MIEPRIDALLLGVAERLERDVLPELDAEASQRQLKAGLGILRRVASVWHEVQPSLVREVRDFEATLQTLAESLARLDALPDTLLPLLDDTVDTFESFDELCVRCRSLQQTLVDLQVRLEGVAPSPERSAVESALFALHRRSIARDRALSGR